MKKKNMIITLLLVLGLLSITIGVSVAFFNYTRTGNSNTLAVGRIYFNSVQGTSINLTNVFPVKSTELENNDNVGEVTLTITGDTTYNEGIEYLISASDVINIVNSKEVPIGISVSVNNLGTSDDSYFENRGGNTSIYKILAKDTISNDDMLQVGYIAKGSTGVNGSITVKAFIDAEKVAISDTFDGNESDNMGTTTDWVGDRVVLTTDEWNNINSNGISFKIKVEANEGIWVEEPLTGEQMVRKAINAKINATTNSCNPIWVDDMDTASDESDDITYFSGTNECVDMNYVWYSGKLWRITAIYPDGSMKLVTQNNITTIAFNVGSVNFYTDENTKSYMYEWLNEDFYDTLYNAEEFIDTTKKWNATMPANTTISTKPAETNMVSANVGLLNSYEYYNSNRCIGSTTCTGSSYGTSYLNVKYYWWLLNSYDASNVWFVDYNGGHGRSSPGNAFGVRPSIYLKSGVEFTGNGVASDPYIVVGDKDIGRANDLINTRLSGEYVKLKNGSNEQIFRIIDVEDNKTKIIAMDYADNKVTRKFATNYSDALWGNVTTEDTDAWYTYLNNTYLPNLKNAYGELFDNNTYYLGTSGYNYKLSVCANTTSGNTKLCDKTTQVGTFDVGLPRYGEMFATQQSGGNSNSINMWLINRFASLEVWFVNNICQVSHGYSYNANGARPTVHLKSTVKILSGSGTELDPYVVGL